MSKDPSGPDGKKPLLDLPLRDQGAPPRSGERGSEAPPSGENRSAKPIPVSPPDPTPPQRVSAAEHPKPVSEPAPGGAQREKAAPPGAAPDPSPSFGGRPSGVRRREESKRRRWPWIVLLLLLLGVAYWLIKPEPGRPTFSAEPATLADVRFGEQGEPYEIVVTNGGELPLETSTLQVSGEAAGDFAILEDGCSVTSLPSGATCSATIRFTPTAVGSRVASLDVIGRKTVSLALVGESTAPRLDRVPETVSFEAHGVGDRAAGADLVISNGGTADLQLRKVYVEGHHTSEFRLAGRCDDKVLTPGESCSFRIAFSPGAAGTRSAELVFETDTPAEIERISIVGEGVWDGPELIAEPARIDAGLVRVGAATRPRSVRFVNRSAVPVEVDSLGVSSSASGFSLRADGCRGARLEPGDDCTAEVGFEPRTAGDQRATLDLRLAAGGGASLPLAGRGGNARLEIGQLELDFGAERVDSGSRSASVEIASVGEIALATSNLSVRGSSASSFRVADESCSAGAVEPGGECTVSIAFRPVAEGSLSARLVVESDSDTGPVEVTLIGQGLAGRLDVSPARADFGSVHRGAGSQETVTLSNAGKAPFRIERVSVGGRAQDEYLLVEDGCGGRELPASGSCTVQVRFLPGAEGRRVAFLVLDHDAISGPGEVALAGEGLPPVPTIRVEPSAIDLGSLSPGEVGPIETITIGNPGLGPLEVRDIVLTGGGREAFRLVPGTCSGVPRLAPRSDCSIGVRFTPPAAGRYAAEVTIDHNAPGGSSRVRLDGEAVAVAPPPGATP